MTLLQDFSVVVARHMAELEWQRQQPDQLGARLVVRQLKAAKVLRRLYADIERLT